VDSKFNIGKVLLYVGNDPTVKGGIHGARKINLNNKLVYVANNYSQTNNFMAHIYDTIEDLSNDDNWIASFVTLECSPEDYVEYQESSTGCEYPGCTAVVGTNADICVDHQPIVLRWARSMNVTSVVEMLTS